MRDRSLEMGIGKRVVISSIFGVFFSAIIFLPMLFGLPEAYSTGADFWLGASIIFDVMFRGLIGFPFFVMVVSPLIAVALIVASTFESSIERHPAAWCITAPMSVWLFVCVFILLRRESTFIPPYSDLKDLLPAMINREVMLFLLGPIPSAAIFYYLTVSRRAGRSEGLANDRA